MCWIFIIHLIQIFHKIFFILIQYIHNLLDELLPLLGVIKLAIWQLLKVPCAPADSPLSRGAEAGSWFALLRCRLLLVVFLACYRLSEPDNFLWSLFCSAASLFGRFCLFVPASTTFFPFQPAIKLCGRTLKSIQILLLLGATCRSSHGASHTAIPFFIVLDSAELRTGSHFSRTLEPPAARAPHCFISRNDSDNVA